MPPYVPSKRTRRSAAVPESKRLKTTSGSSRKSTLYDELDACVTPHTAQSPNALFGTGNDGDGDSSSSLSSLSDSDDFEDVALPNTRVKQNVDSDDDGVEFEDVMPHQQEAPDAPITGDLELTLTRDDRLSLDNNFAGSRGPSKRERIVREATHRMHVQLLLWHNAIRNSWLCDAQVQAIMLSHLTPRMWEEIDRWRRSSGFQSPSKAQTGPRRGGKANKSSHQRPRRRAEDWSEDAAMLEEGAVNMSQGDPLFRLMQALSSWWRQRFCITAPGLRKWGYMPLERLDRLTKSYAIDGSDPVRFGEYIKDLDEFRESAQKCCGSRDVGAQLFTSLLRGLGLESRMVASLQSLGFGWSKVEEAEPEERTKPGNTTSSANAHKAAPSRDKVTASKKLRHSPQETDSTPTGQQSSIDESELALEYADTDDESVVEIPMTRKRTPKRNSIDADLAFPHYWTEVLSPVTHKYLPVDAIVKNAVATNRDLVEQFEPRGVKSRQMLAYVVGFSRDGTAKDVTVRYLKRSVFPGKTKGFRYPVKKVPIYNWNGKVARYEEVDWFKVAMSGYGRGGTKTPMTNADELENSSDLAPAKTEVKQVKEGQETLQYYKQSQDFVLEKHLKREEALRRGAMPVKTFKSKGKGGTEIEEDVFLRSDVIAVKSAETWHKQGLAPNPGEEPLKRVPFRAATTKRRREILDAESSSGQKMLQGLYSFDQTSWIIPPPIQNGIIPKNEYGNIDLFVEHMCPKGAVHVPFRGAVKVCKRLGIDYAEAVVDFEFGRRMAVPVIQGVVVAEEYHDDVMEQLAKDEAERQRKDDEKRRNAALGCWRKLLMGLRIKERINQQYGDASVDITASSDEQAVQSGQGGSSADIPREERLAGGFIHESEDEEGAQNSFSAFFPAGDEHGESSDDEGHVVLEENQQ